jgi:hypothetical protein
MKLKYWIMLLIVLGACKEKYVVNTNVPAAGYLVVEGFINITGTTDIMMTRSSGLDSPILIPEPGAQVEIQSQNGATYPLFESQSGHYSVNNLLLDPTQLYGLHIKTVKGKEYLSDFTVVKIAPPIDTVTWSANSDAVTIYVSSHDNQVQPGYYQWKFEETWRYTSAFSSSLLYVKEDSNLITRPNSDMFYICWQSDLSNTIIISNTEKLSSNVIYKYQITQIPYSSSDKLIERYSILVKQYSLTKDWYEWNLKVRRNTEQLGSIFDAQPSETGGNIHCTTDPTEKVIGFIGSTTETEKRIFIDRIELPPAVVFNPYTNCKADTIPNNQTDIINQFSGGFSIPTHYYYKNGFIVGVICGEPECVDCRLAGGTNVQPPFWQ